MSHEDSSLSQAIDPTLLRLVPRHFLSRPVGMGMGRTAAVSQTLVPSPIDPVARRLMRNNDRSPPPSDIWLNNLAHYLTFPANPSLELILLWINVLPMSPSICYQCIRSVPSCPFPLDGGRLGWAVKIVAMASFTQVPCWNRSRNGA